MHRHRSTLIVLTVVGLAAILLPQLLPHQEPPPPPPPASTQAPALEPALQRAYGTDPGRAYLPPVAVDSTELPNIVLRAEDAADSPLPYYPIAADTYLLLGNVAITDSVNRGWNGNAGFVVTDHSVVVIDSLGTPKLGQRLIATVRSVTDKPISHLILTHNHPDHSYGAAAFRALGGVTIIGHQGFLAYNASPLAEASVNHRKDLLPGDMQGFALVTPDRLIGGEPFQAQTLTVGNKTFHIYNVGQHHSFGDLVVHQVDDHILWISDLAFNQRTTYMGDGHSAQAIAAQNWLLQHFPQARLMVPGHGSAQTPPFSMVGTTQRYMQRLRDTMRRAIDEGQDLNDAVDDADFPDWRSVRLYGLNQRANANFVYREMEDELF